MDSRERKLSDSDPGHQLLAHVLDHAPSLRRRLHCYTRNRADTEELLQDTYVRLLTLNKSGRVHIRSVAALATTIATNVARDWLRRQKVANLSLEIELAEAIGTEAEQPDQAVNTQQEFEIVAGIVECMPERRREVFLLRRAYGLSQKEIARKLAISENTVEQHLSRAARELLRLFSSTRF
jgi:RNA polymerase sigma factor (sigma-70 family)